MRRNSYLLSISLLFCAPLWLFSQNGAISGKIIDPKLAEGLIGCTVRLESGGGAVTDFDGNYRIPGVPAGTYLLTVSYTGYTEKRIEGVLVEAGRTTTVDVVLEDAPAQSIAEVVVTATAQRSTMSALTILQKTSAVVADGISAEIIKRTPDRTTGDVIRRVSGASIQDNRFAVIRGLNDRYNIALLDGALLGSTEPDRKAFSFDLFPSAMLDNLMVLKTAAPDLPGEFAGGAILLNTKDIPEENFLQINAGAGYNTVSTFKPYLTSQGGKTDFLGFDDGTRALSEAFPSTTDFQNASKEEKVRFSQLIANDWALTEKHSAAPNTNLQIAAGLASPANRHVQLGATLAFVYSNQNRLINGERNDYDMQQQLIAYRDREFKNNVLWGSLLHAAMKIGARHQIHLQGTQSVNTTKAVTERTGSEFDQERHVRYTFNEFTENQLYTSRLRGEHGLGQSGKIRLDWGAGYNRMTGDVPALRRMFYSRNFDAYEEDPYRAFVPFGSADPFRSGRFYSTLSENTVNANTDLRIPFALAGVKQSVKIGGLWQKKDRSFSARNLGFIRGRIAGFNTALLELPQDQIFAPENINADGFLLDEITNPSDAYSANSDLTAAYVMIDNSIAEKLRATWGVRMERFAQRLESFEYPGNTPVSVRREITKWLPSINLTYNLNDKHQIRVAGSKTVSRPEFREIAPFSFFDNRLYASVIGNPNLESGDIYNFDLRYEVYPGQNELFSVSLFYKKFQNPIEFTFASTGAGSRQFTFQNIKSANNYGAEAEVRKSLGFISPMLTDLTLFANAALIRSSLDLSNVSTYDSTRALQGQSPYILNGGLSYTHPNWGLSTTLVYNIIGDRVAQVGTVGYADVYERHRNVLDFQISKRFAERRGEVKLTWSDVLATDQIFYQDNNANHHFDQANGDQVMQRLSPGSTVTLSLGWRF